MSTSPVIKTRFAPSPSGHLHVGGARTALYCCAFARRSGGKFLLRIEDTDQKRSSRSAGVAFLNDLRWLGIEWDEGPEFDGCGGGDAGPYHQSERLDVYNTCIDRLVDQGRAYRAFETTDELEKAREEARAEKENYRYDRAALKLEPNIVEQYLADGRPHVVRLFVPRDKPLRFHDEVLGDVSVAAGETDDFVIRKADGFPTYHLAVVVDDELMGVTHVIRGQEHLYNTPKHIFLQEALGFRRPLYAHVSIISNPDNSKMSKRDKDKALRAAVQERGIDQPPRDCIPHDRWEWWLSRKDHQLDADEAMVLARELEIHLPEIDVDDFRRSGYLPEVLINYLSLLGWSPPEDTERFDMAFLIEHISLDRLHKSAAKFDRDKLLAFNHDAIQELSPHSFTTILRRHGEAFHSEFTARLGESFDLFAAINQSRSKTLNDPFTSCAFLMIDDADLQVDETRQVRKALENGDPNGYDHLAGLRDSLATLEDWSRDGVHAAVERYVNESADSKFGKVGQPLRIALTGGTMGPEIPGTLALLGRDSSLTRIDRCLAHREESTARS